MNPTILLFCAALVLPAQTRLPAGDARPPLFFREDWKETPAEKPVTQQHVAHRDLLLSLYGPGKAGLKKSHHDRPSDDPFYIWTGECPGNCAITLKHRSAAADLTGLAKIRWRTKQAGFRQLRLIVKLAGGTWLVSDQSEGASTDWRESEIPIANIRWRKLDIDRVVEGDWAGNPDLSRVDEIGWTDLAPGGGTPACTRVDWIEVYAKAARR